MIKYITRHGAKLTEAELEEVYRGATRFAPFNERDYKAWKYEKLEIGAIKFAEGVTEQ